MKALINDNIQLFYSSELLEKFSRYNVSVVKNINDTRHVMIVPQKITLDEVQMNDLLNEIQESSEIDIEFVFTPLGGLGCEFCVTLFDAR
jgi:hypothetical protein